MGKLGAMPLPQTKLTTTQHFPQSTFLAMRLIVLLITGVLITQIAASPEQAKRIKRSYELSSEAWELKFKLSKTATEKQVLWENRPNPVSTAQKLWPEIAPFLKRDWTMPYAAFYLKLTSQATDPDLVKKQSSVIKIFAENHLTKPGIATFCASLIESGSPKGIPVFEKVIQTNSDETAKGVASLGLALSLKNLGDTPEIIKKRIGYLRDAIIHAADQEIGNTTIADITADELYIIQHLSRGRVAPNFSGKDVAGKTVSFNDFRGKITIILFWDAKSAGTDRMIEITNRMTDKHRDQPVAIIGITPEPFERIRELQGSDEIRWNNIIDPKEVISQAYRIEQRPTAFVLNRKGEIHYNGTPGSFVDLTVAALLSEKD